MWGIAVGTTVAAVAVSAAAADADDDEDEDEGAAAATEATAATTTVASSLPAIATPQGELPCDPLTREQDSTIYYVCGEQHFVLAYGGTGPVYVPVPAP
jgi:hypothetical protein